MRQEESGQSQCAAGVTVGRLALIALVVLTVAFLVPAAQAKDKPEDNTRIYRHTYDEVFQAGQDAIERKGCFVTGADKDKGIISGTCGGGKPTLELHVETVSQNPETRVTFLFPKVRFGQSKGYLLDLFSTELQKVLASYK